jgi:phosphatidate cytidylyltransferase
MSNDFVKEAMLLGEKVNKATGRDMFFATFTALLLIAALIASLFKTEIFASLLVLLSVVAIFELGSAFSTAGIRVPRIFLSICSAIIVFFAYTKGLDQMLLVLIISLLAVPLYTVFDHNKIMRFHNALVSIFTLLYIPFLISFGALIVNLPYGELKVALAISIPVAYDTGGMFVGRFWGKHKMTPRVSPEKSYEGLAGGIALAVGFLYFLVFVCYPADFVNYRLFFPLVAGILGCFSAVVGDLFESQIKRALDIKDMGNILAGHGGVMDRIDSILPSLPLLYLLFMVF